MSVMEMSKRTKMCLSKGRTCGGFSSVSDIVGIRLTLCLLFMLGASDGQSPSHGQSQQVELTYSIQEELEPNTFIANIYEDAKLMKKYEEDTLDQMRFRFLGAPDIDVIIDMMSGILRSGERIDRDAICPQEDDCVIKFDIVTFIPEPLRFLESIKVNIVLLDLNDNQPTFIQPFLSQDVLESSPLGRVCVIQTASDPDSGFNGVQSYELMSDSSKFAMNVQDKLDGSQELWLMLTEGLDRELVDVYRMKVIAYDGGVPAMSGTIDVVINVIDANDNDPIFSNLTYEVKIPENTPAHTSITRVMATDLDAGLNGEVIYGFAASTQSTSGKFFQINNVTGEIYISGVLDYETTHVYHLTVTVQDRGPAARLSETTVIVRLTDVNDNAPDIKVNTLTATELDLAEIAEDSDTESFVAHITVEDPDSEQNGRFNCTLNDNTFRLQELYNIDKHEYQIVTKTTLNREQRAQYSLALVCQDYGTPQQVSLKHIQISVVDVNDNRPVFSPPSYAANLIENNQIGQFVVQVNASDLDAGRNGHVEYAMDDQMNAIFDVNPISGVITARAVLDHEQIREITFHVLAVDQGQPQLTGTAIIIVYLTDVNDEKPQFSQSSYSLGVFENEPPGTEVGILHAMDLDSAPNNVIAFEIVDPDDDIREKFIVDSKTGIVRTKVNLDREEQGVYHMLVRVVDMGVPPQSSTVSVAIYVADKNDHHPDITYPTPFNNTVHISNMSPVGHAIAKIEATDKDIGKYANLSYYFSKGNELDLFHMNIHSGVVSVRGDLSTFRYDLFELEVLVTDQGDVSMYGRQDQQSALTNLNIVVNHSIAFHTSLPSALLGGNLTIVIVVACISAIVAIVLVICIVTMLHRQKRDSSKNGKYVDAMKMISISRHDDNKDDDMDRKLNSISNSDMPNGNHTTVADMEKGYSNKSQIHKTSPSQGLGEHQINQVG